MAKLLGDDNERYRHYRVVLAPGTPLREGLNRVVHGHTGALVVLGDSVELQEICTGGFTLNTQFTPTALRELSKMDGGIVLSNDLETIVRAGVHFVPDGSLPTIETGTRHRTADRIAQQTDIAVATVSASMGTIALFMAGIRYEIETSTQILSRANQALSTMNRYWQRVRSQSLRLTSLEIDHNVSVNDVLRVIQPVVILRQLTQELEGYIEALGVDGRLMQLQVFEVTNGIDQLANLLELDYLTKDSSRLDLDSLKYLPTGDLLDPESLAQALGFDDLNQEITSHGYRILAQAAQLNLKQLRNLVDAFGTLEQLLTANQQQLTSLAGLSPNEARTLSDGLARVVAQSKQTTDSMLY